MDGEVDGKPQRAIAYPELTGELRVGDRVWLNTTAVALSLGTGGTHFVVARADVGHDAPEIEEPFPGREAGHLLKLRYTPLQHRVFCAEEEESPHRAAVEGFRSLAGIPVLAVELHSAAGAAALAAHALRPGLRLAWVQTDSAALPLALSRLVARLRDDGVITATLTTGQAWGGDHETVTLHSALAVAASVVRSDLILVTQGPGNAGTGTAFGFSGLALIEALHAAHALHGTPLLAARMSSGDPRPRHQGLSHHTRTMLQCLRTPVTMPLPTGERPDDLPPEHEYPGIDTAPVFACLEPYRHLLRTMGRDLDEDPLFFRAAAAAGVACITHARRESS